MLIGVLFDHFRIDSITIDRLFNGPTLAAPNSIVTPKRSQSAQDGYSLLGHVIRMSLAQSQWMCSTLTTLPTAIETGTTGLWYGRFIDLLGTHARAKDRQSLLRMLHDELCYHSVWLQRHGETPLVLAESSIDVAQEILGVEGLGESGGEVALFKYDHRRVTGRMMEDIIRFMGHNRQDLMQLVGDLSPEQMTLVPEGKMRDITGILRHVCNAEEFYITRLGHDADSRYERYAGMTEDAVDQLPLFQRLEVVRRACVATLRELVPQRGARVFTRKEYTAHPEEKWTTHKVMRRFLEHEREHIYNIQEYLGLPPRDTG
ncbi:MAG: hypothetical protein C4K49_11140 [Candidatus Thorarchaeota archaeon]|nr:MAG: hypothetical protein C4K49_11140 [Candidatus Thorarchaeota archaeon]